MTAPSKRAKRRPVAIRYFWFQGASVRELYDRLSAAGPDTARFEVHLDGRKATLNVVAEVSTQVHELDHINDSHVCPPQCG